jgi:hypothetical protein
MKNVKNSTGASSKDRGPEYLRQTTPSQVAKGSEEILLEETQYGKSHAV